MIDNRIYPQDPSLEILAHPELSKQGFWMQDWMDKLVLDTAALWTAKGIGKFDRFETLREAVSCVGVGLHDLDSVFLLWLLKATDHANALGCPGVASRVCCLVGDTAQLSQTKIAPSDMMMTWFLQCNLLRPHQHLKPKIDSFVCFIEPHFTGGIQYPRVKERERNIDLEKPWFPIRKIHSRWLFSTSM